MTFLLLAIQSSVCVLAVTAVKKLGFITCTSIGVLHVKGSRADRLRPVRDFDKNDAKAWWPISTLLVAVIYTGSKALVSSIEGIESQSMLIKNPSNSCLSPSTRKTDDFETLDRTNFICSIFKNLTIILIVSIIIVIQGAKTNLFTGLRRSVHVQRFRHRSHSLLIRAYGEYFQQRLAM